MAKSEQLKEWDTYDDLLKESLDYSTEDLRSDYWLMVETFGVDDPDAVAYKREIELRGEDCSKGD
jgi:hypothetical protein